jgi:DNA (cytosine-5)-methyltransferase 1
MIVDLFAGPGGWEEGLNQLGIRNVVGLEIDDDACATATAAGHRREQVDVSAVDPHSYAGADGLIASPPCQDWSQAGKASPSSMHRTARAVGTADLTHLVYPWVHAVRPQWVACEQVRDALPAWHKLSHDLNRIGYRTWTGLLNAADYGVPQRRLRAFMLATLEGPIGPPNPTHTEGGLFGCPPVSAEVALGLEPGCWIDRRNNSRGPQGTTVPVAPVPCSRPAPTVTGQAGGGQWLICHPNGTRSNLTVSQASALQSFPAGYPWQGTKSSQAQQVGNAVPPLLAASVVSAVTQTRVVPA